MPHIAFDSRPFPVQHGEPGGIAVPFLDDVMLSENALKTETEPQGGCPRAGIERIALPLDAPVFQLVKCFGQHEVYRFSVDFGVMNNG